MFAVVTCKQVAFTVKRIRCEMIAKATPLFTTYIAVVAASLRDKGCFGNP